MRTYGKMLTGLLVISLICISVEASDHGAISGRVTWKGGYGAVSDAVVYLYDLSYNKIDSAISNQFGNFDITARAGRYLISAEKNNLVKEYYPEAYFADDADRVVVSAGQNTQLAFSLDAGGWITGTFSYNGSDVESGLITALKIDQPYEGWYKSMTLNGPFPSAYAVDGLIPGTYKILGRAHGKRTEYYPGVENIEDANPINVFREHGVADISMTLDEVGWGFIQGQILNQMTGQGIADLPLYAYQWRDFWQDPNLTSIRSNIDGTYLISIPAGDYFLFTAYSTNSGARTALYYDNCFEPTSAEIIHVEAGQIVQGVDFGINFTVKHNLTISGTILNQRSGYGLNDALVVAINYETGLAAGSAISIHDGGFSINNLSLGPYLLMVSGTNIIPYYYPQTENWQDAEVINLTSHFSNIRTEAITQDYGNNGLTIAGSVTSSDGPLVSARIYAYLEGESIPIGYARTDENGAYSIVTGLVPGSYTVTCNLFGYENQIYPDPIELDLMTNPEVSNINFSLFGATAVDDGVQLPGDEITLAGNYPNPFNSKTLIRIFSNRKNEIDGKLTVYDILGRTVGEKAVQINPGYNLIEWGADDFTASVSSGIYYCHINGQASSHKMILLK
jgi:hypothetical protein